MREIEINLNLSDTSSSVKETVVVGETSRSSSV